MIRKVWGVLLAAMVSLAGGCGGDKPSGTGSSGEGKTSFHIAVIPKGTSSPFWEDNREDEGEVCALIRIIETVFTIYDVGWLGWILQKKIVLK